MTPVAHKVWHCLSSRCSPTSRLGICAPASAASWTRPVTSTGCAPTTPRSGRRFLAVGVVSNHRQLLSGCHRCQAGRVRPGQATAARTNGRRWRRVGLAQTDRTANRPGGGRAAGRFGSPHTRWSGGLRQRSGCRPHIDNTSRLPWQHSHRGPARSISEFSRWEAFLFKDAPSLGRRLLFGQPAAARLASQQHVRVGQSRHSFQYSSASRHATCSASLAQLWNESPRPVLSIGELFAVLSRPLITNASLIWWQRSTVDWVRCSSAQSVWRFVASGPGRRHLLPRWNGATNGTASSRHTSRLASRPVQTVFFKHLVAG